MWEYNYSDRNDWLEHAAIGSARANHKYIKRNFINGKWVYEYANNIKNKAISTGAGIAAGGATAVGSFKARKALNDQLGRKTTLKTVVNAAKDGKKAMKVGKKATEVGLKAKDVYDDVSGKTEKAKKEISSKAKKAEQTTKNIVTKKAGGAVGALNDPKLAKSQYGTVNGNKKAKRTTPDTNNGEWSKQHQAEQAKNFDPNKKANVDKKEVTKNHIKAKAKYVLKDAANDIEKGKEAISNATKNVTEPLKQKSEAKKAAKEQAKRKRIEEKVNKMNQTDIDMAYLRNSYGQSKLDPYEKELLEKKIKKYYGKNSNLIIHN